MKKTLLVNAAVVAMLAMAGTASANEDTTAETMPIDTGIVIDTNSTDQAPPTVVESEVTDNVPTPPQTGPTTEGTDTSAADGTVLPIDQGDVNAVEKGEEEPVVNEPQAPAVTPDKDKVVLSEKEPVVEPLPKTGIEDNALLYSFVALILGAAGFLFTRRAKTE